MHTYLFFVPGKLRVEHAIQYCYCISDLMYQSGISYRGNYNILF